MKCNICDNQLVTSPSGLCNVCIELIGGRI